MSAVAQTGGFTARHRDLVAGALTLVFGAAVLKEASRYGMGTLERMGPGLFPSLLGGVLILVGALIMGSRATGGDEEPGHAVEGRPDWRGWSCILAGVLAFIVLGDSVGLGPATFACVFIAALGDRLSSLRGSLALAVGCTVFAAVVFTGMLKFQLPFLRW